MVLIRFKVTEVVLLAAFYKVKWHQMVVLFVLPICQPWYNVSEVV